MQQGDAVQVDIAEDVMIVGRLIQMGPRRSTVVEAHAFHRMWGGSNACRGEKHRVDTKKLEPCYRPYKRIVDKFCPA